MQPFDRYSGLSVTHFLSEGIGYEHKTWRYGTSSSKCRLSPITDASFPSQVRDSASASLGRHRRDRLVIQVLSMQGLVKGFSSSAMSSIQIRHAPRILMSCINDSSFIGEMLILTQFISAKRGRFDVHRSDEMVQRFKYTALVQVRFICILLCRLYRLVFKVFYFVIASLMKMR